jgi:hypothetical protein
MPDIDLPHKASCISGVYPLGEARRPSVTQGGSKVVTGRSYGPTPWTLGRKRGKKQEEQSPAQRTFDRRTGELNSPLSGSARSILLLTGYGKRPIRPVGVFGR